MVNNTRVSHYQMVGVKQQQHSMPWYPKRPPQSLKVNKKKKRCVEEGLLEAEGLARRKMREPQMPLMIKIKFRRPPYYFFLLVQTWKRYAEKILSPFILVYEHRPQSKGNSHCNWSFSFHWGKAEIKYLF